ncbi:MAG: aminoacyl-tRNA hydrolase [Candidatus Altiarchaeales archaeon ex4484_96]|nr:MAG: aminoacyl-tRNA hydrolase [Candidatus Altiarchaeales archaeon ex4484_96]
MNIKKLFKNNSELKQVIVVREDLKMSKGKTAAQVAHAALSAADKSPHKREWINQGQKKSVLSCADERELLELLQSAKEAGLPAALVIDQGRTELESGTKTCIGLGPTSEECLDKITGELKLL